MNLLKSKFYMLNSSSSYPEYCFPFVHSITVLAYGKRKREGCRREVTEGLGGGGLVKDSVGLKSVKRWKWDCC